MSAADDQPAAAGGWLRRVGNAVWRLVVTTVGSCMRYRVTGLAAEAAFFAILSIPPLVFALAGSIGFVSDRFSAAQLSDFQDAVLNLANKALTDRAVSKIIEPNAPPTC